MSIRVEWLDDERSILCYAPLGIWNWQNSQRLMDEWIRPILANASKEIALVADLRQCQIGGADLDLLLKRLNQLVHDSAHAKVLAVVGMPNASIELDVMHLTNLADAQIRLGDLLKKTTVSSY